MRPSESVSVRFFTQSSWIVFSFINVSAQLSADRRFFFSSPLIIKSKASPESAAGDKRARLCTSEKSHFLQRQQLRENSTVVSSKSRGLSPRLFSRPAGDAWKFLGCFSKEEVRVRSAVWTLISPRARFPLFVLSALSS